MNDLLCTIASTDYGDCNCFLLAIIAHGTGDGYLKSAPGKALFQKEPTAKKSWNIENVVSKLDKIPSLKGKPKLLLIQACRGGKGMIYLIFTHPCSVYLCSKRQETGHKPDL